jgi:serine phosphatase RsbU (regulator of sigma subunit)
MKIPFAKPQPKGTLRTPERPAPVDLRSITVGALYRGARKGGDYFDYMSCGPRLVMLMLDIAGRRDEALNVASFVQSTFRAAADLFAIDDVNESVALSQLLLEVNRAIIEASGGVRCAPGIIASYNEVAGTLWYINAGHTPPLMKDPTAGVNPLPAGGLPLGLFSHATHDANICVMPEGSALLLVSRGLVEAKAGGEEFGLERVSDTLASTPLTNGQELCVAIHEAVRIFIESKPKHRFVGGTRTVGEEDPFSANDATALAVVRAAAAKAAAQG